MSGVNIEYKGEPIATIPDTGSKTIKTQGKYCEGDILVEYEAPQPTLITKQITENGTYAAAEDNADGFSEVAVNVPDSKAFLDSLIDKTITAIKSDVTSIGTRTFQGCNNLTSVEFPLAESIGTSAFEGCKLSGTIIFPSVKSIEFSAFAYGIGANTSVIFPLLNVISESAFLQCGLVTADFPSATVIESRTFSRNRALQDINIPNVEDIKYAAFDYCYALKIDSMPSKIKTIGEYAFEDCNSIESLDMSEVLEIPAIANNSFVGTTFPFLFSDQAQLDLYANATNWSALADRFQIKGATA
nr:leucine-rich repeat protein [uncultured Ruminococcus sp.]